MPNIICAIDVASKQTWFAFNTRTGDFACLTNLEARRGLCRKEELKQCSELVLEYVKINDSSIDHCKKTTFERFLSQLYDGRHRNSNFLFGNILDDEQDDSRRFSGKIRHYINTNKTIRKFESPQTL